MAQSNVVMAFRKRLKSYGYYGISIVYDEKLSIFHVSAFEPLAGEFIKRDCTEFDMMRMFR